MKKNTIVIILLLLSIFMLASCQPANQEFVPVQSVSETAAPLPTATPMPTQVSLVTQEMNSEDDIPILEIPYTKDNPVTDNQEIITILESFVPRFLSQFSRPGWYYFPNNNQNRCWMHIPEKMDDDHFDVFLSTTEYHTYAPGFIWPFSIVLQDGSWGFSRLSPRFNDYQFNQGGKQSEIPPTLDNLDYFAGCKNCSYFGYTSLMDFVDMLNNPNRVENNVEISRTFSGWVEQDNGKAVFVLLIHETYPGMKPKLESSRQVIDRRDQYTYFDMDNGGRMFEKSVYFLEDGDIDEGELQFNQHLVQYYEALPEEIQTVYDEAAQKLKDYLEEQ